MRRSPAASASGTVEALQRGEVEGVARAVVHERVHVHVAREVHTTVAIEGEGAHFSFGASVEEHRDGLTIRPGPLRGTTVDPLGDHRLAMAFAVTALRRQGLPGILSDRRQMKPFLDFRARFLPRPT